MLSFSDTGRRVPEHPSCIWLLCHKSVKETSQPDLNSCSGCHTPNTRAFECWDQNPFTSWAAPLVQWSHLTHCTPHSHTHTRLPHPSAHSAEEPKISTCGPLSSHSPRQHKLFLLPSLPLLLCLPVSIPLADPFFCNAWLFTASCLRLTPRAQSAPQSASICKLSYLRQIFIQQKNTHAHTGGGRMKAK